MTLMRGYDGRTLAILLGNINKGLGEYRIIGMLVVYCLKDVQIASATHELPELIAGRLWRSRRGNEISC